MKLFLISQIINLGYDTYDSAVVAAQDQDDARTIHPNGSVLLDGGNWHSWVKSPKDVIVDYIGDAARGTVRGVVCASFNAG